MFGAFGDPHGDFAAVRRVIDRHPECPYWVCVGDLGGDEGHYEPVPVPIYWIKGNNEDFDFVAAPPAWAAEHLRFIPNGTLATVQGLRIAGLGGTFAPTWYTTPAADLPHPAFRAGVSRTSGAIARDKRRHFVE